MYEYFSNLFNEKKVTNKTLLFSLIFYSVICLLGSVSVIFDIPQLIMLHDHLYLSFIITFVYFGALLYSFISVMNISITENEINNFKVMFNKDNTKLKISEDNNDIILTDDKNNIYLLQKSFLNSFYGFLKLTNTVVKNNKQNNDNLKQMPLDEFDHDISKHYQILTTISSFIVWFGIFATILGIILVFWPFVGGTMEISMLKQNFGMLFSGLAIAFIPTAISFIAKMTLDILLKILESGIDSLYKQVSIINIKNEFIN